MNFFKYRFLILVLGIFLFNTSLCSAEEQAKTVYTLEECLELAYKNSESIKTASINVSQARYSVKRARAALMPSLTYGVTGQEQDEILGYSADLTVDKTLYSWGILKADLKTAQYRLENALEDERKAKQKLTYSVKEAFYQLWLIGEKLQVTQASYNNMEKHFLNTKQQYEMGEVSRYELLQAEVQWKKIKPKVIQGKNQLALSRLNLAILIGIDSNQLFEIDAETISRVIPREARLTVDTVLETAYQERPELKQIKNSIEVAKITTKMAKVKNYPTLVFSGSYKAQGDDSGFDDWNKNLSLTLNFSGTLFDGFSNQAEVGTAKEDEKLQQSKETQLRNDIRLEVEQEMQSLEESIEVFEANKANVELAKEALRLIRVRLDEGLATTTDLNDAQLDLDEALNSYYEGICDYLTVISKLSLITGKNNLIQNSLDGGK